MCDLQMLSMIKGQLRQINQELADCKKQDEKIELEKKAKKYQEYINQVS